MRCDDEYRPLLSRHMWEEIDSSDPFANNLALIDRVYLVQVALAAGFPDEIVEELFDSTITFRWHDFIKQIRGETDSKDRVKARYRAKAAAVYGLVQASCAHCGQSFMKTGNTTYCSFQCRMEGRNLKRKRA